MVATKISHWLRVLKIVTYYTEEHPHSVERRSKSGVGGNDAERDLWDTFIALHFQYTAVTKFTVPSYIWIRTKLFSYNLDGVNEF